MTGINENKHMKFRIAAILLSALFFLQACSRTAYKNNFNDPVLFSKTVKELNNVVMQNGFPPIIASRNYAYASIAAYETMVLGDDRFLSLAGQIKHLPAMPAQDTAEVNFQYASLLAFCKVGEAVTFPKGSMKEYINRLDSIAAAGNMSASMQEASNWMNIVGIAAKKAGADFSATVSSYTKTAIAVFDAFIQCWDEKYRSNVIRPETAINKYIDDEWMPYLQTPPFPEYTCGHSTVSSSAAEVLTNVFGDNFNYTDTSELEFGIKNRSFTSFRQAAIENNWARFYGGIHYHNSCIISTEYGKKVGELVNDRLKMKK
ncbi:MAG: vanadium-dependent haloperoxidase [Chitinophagaceae bacterium]|nr:vanadium-dependent haloperoxidase [Chitinophagaceae bacterium]